MENTKGNYQHWGSRFPQFRICIQGKLHGMNINTYFSLESDADREKTAQDDTISDFTRSDTKKRRKREKINIRTGLY